MKRVRALNKGIYGLIKGGNELNFKFFKFWIFLEGIRLESWAVLIPNGIPRSTVRSEEQGRTKHKIETPGRFDTEDKGWRRGDARCCWTQFLAIESRFPGLIRRRRRSRAGRFGVVRILRFWMDVLYCLNCNVVFSRWVGCNKWRGGLLLMGLI